MSGNIEDSLGHELAVIANALELLERRIFAVRQQIISSATGKLSALDQARLHFVRRKSRENLFGNSHLFGEPAWDMLVDLFIAAEQQKNISVSSLCVASAAPQTTALRWIAILENLGLVVRTADQTDARRYFISLTKQAHGQVEAHFADYHLKTR
jgi:hypothetical protein